MADIVVLCAELEPPTEIDEINCLPLLYLLWSVQKYQIEKRTHRHVIRNSVSNLYARIITEFLESSVLIIWISGAQDNSENWSANQKIEPPEEEKF